MQDASVLHVDKVLLHLLTNGLDRLLALSIQR